MIIAKVENHTQEHKQAERVS